MYGTLGEYQDCVESHDVASSETANTGTLAAYYDTHDVTGALLRPDEWAHGSVWPQPSEGKGD